MTRCGFVVKLRRPIDRPVQAAIPDHVLRFVQLRQFPAKDPSRYGNGGPWSLGFKQV